MTFELIEKIHSDPNQIKYLREYSYWYKYLNRSNLYYQEFLKSMKKTYKLNPQDRINKVITNINMIKTFLDVLK